MDTIDRLVQMLAETREELAIERREHRRTRMDLMQQRQERERAVRDLGAAEDKIAEWLSHSEHMSRLVPKRRRKEIGPLPKPLETEIPF